MKGAVSSRIFSVRKEEEDKGRCRLVINLSKRSGFRSFRKFMSSRAGTAHTSTLALLLTQCLIQRVGPLISKKHVLRSTSILYSGWYPKPSPAPILSYLLGWVRNPPVTIDRNPTQWTQSSRSPAPAAFLALHSCVVFILESGVTAII